MNLTLHPSPLVYVAMAVAFFYAIHRLLNRASDQVPAVRVVRRASLVVLLIAVGSILIADVWFFATPLEGWPSPGTWVAPFPFGTQDVNTKVVNG